MPGFDMSTQASDLGPGLHEHVHVLRTCSGGGLEHVISNLRLYDCLPVSFLDTLDKDDKIICYWAALMCYSVTNSTQVPREMHVMFPLGHMFDLNSRGLLHWTSCGEQWLAQAKVLGGTMKTMK
jgi:hypothetical protein